MSPRPSLPSHSSGLSGRVSEEQHIKEPWEYGSASLTALLSRRMARHGEATADATGAMGAQRRR
eukprot:CAMPEP_0118974286 /NCGR_PEP_ID=MMETSP1173-20130426/11172_1 /TAXON_ID=1034831 /ORGANISM="Rhizochromulina marina cf, Strain CCMP1243" /LENGTH=63 /DNA_ID=CAMNT_0006924001 /DNA_START=485 /DNA_END=673 /DNA_ORIENTATION=-